MIHSAYIEPIDSVAVAIRKERDNRNLKERVTVSFLLFWTDTHIHIHTHTHTHTHTHIYRPVLYDVAGRVWGGLTANERV